MTVVSASVAIVSRLGVLGSVGLLDSFEAFLDCLPVYVEFWEVLGVLETPLALLVLSRGLFSLGF